LKKKIILQIDPLFYNKKYNYTLFYFLFFLVFTTSLIWFGGQFWHQVVPSMNFGFTKKKFLEIINLIYIIYQIHEYCEFKNY
jgi:hypothetical protein